ncbi:MAG: damage-inducible protein, partial [Candidatus Poribacteria bacterium]|nr:damage-inducible protein [Candidatus Poribacteria bacterium]
QQELDLQEWLPDNNERAERQQELPIEVIIGNPPWSAGQKKATDDNPNVKYPELEQRITDTYVDRTTTTLKRYLYDTYKMAIRWASDRIGEHGVIAFVTPASWIDGNAETGIRECLAEEFSSIYVLNLLGNARIHGKQGRYQGGGVFGNATQSPVAITILVKNLNTEHSECSINYRDIGGELRGEKKLEKLKETVSISGFSDWQAVKPNRHHEWIGQRSDAFTEFYPLGTKEAKAGKTDDAIFTLYSLGWATNRDAYLYNFSRDTLLENARLMTEDYLTALSEFETTLKANPELLSNKNALKSVVKEITQRHNSNSKWNSELQDDLIRKKETSFDNGYVRRVMYRPFVATNCYADYTFIHRKYQMDRIFPNSSSENRVICFPNRGARVPFSVLITDTILDLNFFDSGSQCFPRWCYPQSTNADQLMDEEIPKRIDNISDTALCAFREHYADDAITKDDIFDYVYGILHASSYREEFANDLSKTLPRIPYAPDFYAFAEAGAVLASLHLNYETCERYPDLEVEPVTPSLLWEEKTEHFLLGTRVMRFADKNTKNTLIINEQIRLTGIPDDAHHYLVDGKTPLEWFINR